MREIQASFHAKEERHADRADRLEAEVARLSRNVKQLIDCRKSFEIHEKEFSMVL